MLFYGKTHCYPFICVISPVGAKLEVFVLAGSFLRAQARLELAAGPVWPGPDQAGLLRLSTEILRSPGSVCQERAVIQAEARGALPPSHSNCQTPAQSETRWGEVWGGLLPVCCRNTSRVKDITISAVETVWQQSTPVSIEDQERLRGEEVSLSGSCFHTTIGRKVVCWVVISYLAHFPCFTFLRCDFCYL